MIDEKMKWLFSHEPVEISKIEAIESVFNVKFPKDYIGCVKENHGGHPSFEIYDFEGHEEADFNSLLSFDSRASSYILGVYNNIRDRLVENVFPFADDPFGNFICFDYRGGKDVPPTIVFWDHEMADGEPERAVFPICDSFTELLCKLREG